MIVALQKATYERCSTRRKIRQGDSVMTMARYNIEITATSLDRYTAKKIE